MVMRLGQTEAVSLTIISGIVISLVGAAYFWGMPLIDKRAASTEFSSAGTTINAINEKIMSLANAGGGKAEVELTKALTLVPAEAADPDNNSIILTFGVNQPIIYPGAEGGVLYLGATNFGGISEDVGIFGQSSPGVITVRQTKTPEGSYTLSMKLRYRELRTSGAQVKAYKIILCGEDDLDDCAKEATGTRKLVISFRGAETVPGTPDLIVTKIGVKLT